MQVDKGETVIITATIKDFDTSVLADPTTTVITITNPSGTALVTDQSMTQESAGVYTYDYTIPTTAVTGRFETKVSASGSNRTTVQFGSFYVAV